MKNERGFNKSNKWIFSLTIGIVFILIVGGFYAIYYASTSSNVNNFKAESMYTSQKVQYYLSINIENLNLSSVNVEHLIKNNASDEELLAYLSRESLATSQLVKENFSGVYGWINGKFINGMKSEIDENYDPSTRPWYNDAVKANGKTVLVSPYKDYLTGHIIISISKLLDDGKSVLSMDIYLDYLQDLAKEISASNTHHFLVSDHNGTIVACEESSSIGKNILRAKTEEEKFFANAIYSKDYSVTQIKFNGVKYLFFDQVIDNDWHTVMLVERKHLVGQLWFIYPLCILVTGGALFFVVFIFSSMSKRRTAIESYNGMLSAVADIYLCAFEIDLLNDTFSPIKTLSYIKDVFKKHHGKASEVFFDIIKELSLPESWNVIKPFVNLSNLTERMGSSSSLTLEFNGIMHHVRARFLTIEKDNLGFITKAMFLIENIDNEVKTRRELMRVASTDKLTGALNRRAWEEFLAEVRELPSLDSISIVEFDVNGLKHANDNIGHKAGDELIIGASEVITQCFGDYGETYRIGGDEFAVLCDKAIDADEIIAVFKDACRAWHGTLIDELAISIGISNGHSDSYDSVDDLIKLADQRMYEDKNRYYMESGHDRRK